jgi:hypothetical protein
VFGFDSQGKVLILCMESSFKYEKTIEDNVKAMIFGGARTYALSA